LSLTQKKNIPVMPSKRCIVADYGTLL